MAIPATTAHAMTGDREKSIDAGMNDHLSKPINPNQLFYMLAKWIKPKERELPTDFNQKIAAADL